MHQFLGLPKPTAPILALAGAFLVGCATTTPRGSNPAAVQSLSYEQFDQTFGYGWRMLFDQREYAKAARLIEDYLRSRHELTISQQRFLHLHAAMMFALQKRTIRAVKHLDQAVTACELPELWPDWNDFIAANRAFLVHDRASLQAARARLAASHSPRLVQVDRLVQTFGGTYADWYFWARVCPKVVIAKDSALENQALAEKLATTLGASFFVSKSGAFMYLG